MDVLKRLEQSGIVPVVVLDEVTRSASLEELKAVAPEMYRITISEKNEGGDHRE